MPAKLAAAAQQQLHTLETEGYTQLNAQRRKVELRRLFLPTGPHPAPAGASWLVACTQTPKHLLAVCLGLYLLCPVCLFCRAGALPAQLRWLRALCGRYCYHCAGGALCHRSPQPLSGATKIGRGPARSPTPRRTQLRRCPNPTDQRHLPRCERAVDLKDGQIDFCPHCGIGLFDHCGQCSTRKSAFARFCHACGTAARLPNQAALHKA